MPLIPADILSLVGTPSLVADEALNDSDKTLTVPANVDWIIQQIWVELVTDATVGNRQLEVVLQDDAGTPDVIARIAAGAVQATSLTRNYIFGPFLPDLTAFRAGNLLMTPLPIVVLPSGYRIRVYDSAAVAATTDDMVVQALVIARS